MRVSNLFFVALPALAAAQDQFPLFDQAKNWFDRASDFVKSAATNPGRIAAAKVAERTVTPLSYENWRSVLQHSGNAQLQGEPDHWMIYMTGGNKTCRGKCDRANEAWNEAVTLMAADATAPNLASVDCESQELLCGSWATTVATVWYWLSPAPAVDQSTGPTHITLHRLNITTVTPTDITKIYTQKLYLETPRMDGALHPVDGWVAKFGLTSPLAYALFYISRIPSWAFMIFLSLFSRYFVSKRMPPAQPAGQPRPAAAPAAQ